MSTPASSFGDKGDFHLESPAKASIAPVVLPSPLHSSELSDASTDAEEGDQEQEAIVVEEVLQTVRHRYHGRHVEDYPTFLLPRGQQSFDTLTEKLEDEGFLNFFEGIRSRWNAATGRLTLIFMADPLHEVLKQEFDFQLRVELNRLTTEYPSIQPLRDDIVAAGHAHIRRGKGFKRSPDGQHRYQASKYPPFIYEIAHSQRDKDLEEAVHEYFDVLAGNIGALLAFTFDYNPNLVGTPDFSYTGWLSLWTARTDGDTLYQTHMLDKVVFRDKGQSLPGSLELPLHLFVPPLQRNKMPEDAQDAKIRFDFERLGSWVALAERHQRASKEATPAEDIHTLSSLERKVICDAESREVETRQIKIRQVGRVPVRRASEQTEGSVATRSRSASLPDSRPRRTSRRPVGRRK